VAVLDPIDPFGSGGGPLGPKTEPLRSNPKVTVETFPAEPIKQSQSGVIQWSWAGLAMTIIGFGLAATKLSADQQKTVKDFAELLLPYVGVGVGFLATWYHRVKATQAIKGGSADPQVMAQKIVGDRVRARR
jgi:hypothetical protein